MLCECGHEEDRHAAMHDSNAGPCLRCNCSHFGQATLMAVDESPEPTEEEMARHREQLLRMLANDAA